MRPKSKTEPWKKAQPYIMGAAQGIQANQGNLDANAASINSLIPGLQDRINNPPAELGAARGYLTDVLEGDYLDAGNPHLQGMIDQTGQSVRNQVNSTFGRAGRTGGSDHAGVVTDRLADAENRLRYQDYGNERNAMGQAAGMAPGVSAAELAPIAAMIQAAQAGGTLPLAGPAAMGGLLGPYTQTTQSQGLGQTLMGLGGLGLAAFGGGGPFAGLLAGKGG